MDGIWIAIVAIVCSISLGFLLGRKSLSKKMRKMEKIVQKWERTKIAIQYGTRIRARITEVKHTPGIQPGTTNITIIGQRQVVGMSKPFRFRETFVIDNNSQARYHIPIEGDTVKILYYHDGNSPYYFMERPWD